MIQLPPQWILVPMLESAAEAVVLGYIIGKYSVSKGYGFWITFICTFVSFFAFPEGLIVPLTIVLLPRRAEPESHNADPA